MSWGAVLSGAVTMLAVSVLLWMLALAIVSVATHPTAGSLKGSAVVLWICAIATTLIGAFVGGVVAGAVPRAGARRLSMMHGFVAWGVALLVSLGFQLAALRASVDTTAAALGDAIVAQQATAGTGGAAFPGGTVGADGRRANPRAEPGTARGEHGSALMQPGAPDRERATSDGQRAIDYVTGAAWSWFGTWFLAGILAVIGAGIGARRREIVVRDEGPAERERPVRPLTPAPTA